jgi:hypothetical protein
MDDTANLKLPNILPSQAQKHVTHNEALRILDALVQLSVKSASLSAPPATPVEGERYIVAPAPTGAWAVAAGQIAAFQDGAWRFLAPAEGWLAYVEDENKFLYLDSGGAWADFGGTITALQGLKLLGIGTTADAVNPFSAKLNKALWTASYQAEGGDGDLRYTLNKEETAGTLSLLMQTDWSGRAEIGLTGDDDLSFKVSADGTNWTEAMTIDHASGDIGLPANRLGIGTIAPSRELEIVAAVPHFKVTGTDNNASIEFIITDEGNLFFQKGTGDANWNFRLNPLDGTGQAQYIFGQTTGSTGATLITLLNPDNSQQARISSIALDSFVCASGGNFGIGVTSPDEKLRVAGRIKAEGLLPDTDNAHDLGEASLRYRTVYAATGAIDTSDATLKADIAAIPQAILEALRPVTAKLYRHIDAIEAKGPEAARWHYGYLAQEIEAALSGLKLDGAEIEAFRHALLCRDEIFEKAERGTDAHGRPIVETRPTGRYRYGLRYSELFALRDEMHRRDIKALEERVERLETGN